MEIWRTLPDIEGIENFTIEQIIENFLRETHGLPEDTKGLPLLYGMEENLLNYDYDTELHKLWDWDCPCGLKWLWRWNIKCPKCGRGRF